MLVVDAGALHEVVTATVRAPAIGARWSDEDALAAPHVVDVEVLGVVRDHHLRGLLDTTAATQAVRALRAWPGLRSPHDPLPERAWELRADVRGWDAMYVALAESLGATLQTTDARLAAAPGPRCAFDVVGQD